MHNAKSAEEKKPRKKQIELFISDVSLGLPPSVACHRLGMSFPQYKRLMDIASREAREGASNWATKLLERATRAETDVEKNIVERWLSHTHDDWKACSEFLERRFPERWAKTDRIVLEASKDDKPIVVKFGIDD